MADLNKLAILINLSDSDIYSLADNLGIDASILENAILNGESGLSRYDRLELEETMSRYERTQLDDFAGAELEDLTKTLNEITYELIDDFRNGDIMRQSVAESRIELSELETFDLLMGQGSATMNIQNTLIDWLQDNGNTASTFLDLFAQDGYRIDNIHDSVFWAWYRGEFYND